MDKNKFFLIGIFLMLCFSLDAQIIPDNIKLIGSLRDVKLVDQDDAELTPEQIAFLGEYGFDTDAYYSLSKRLKTATWICTSGAAVSIATGAAFFYKGYRGDISTKNVIGFLTGGGIALLWLYRDFIYTIASVSKVRKSVSDAYLRIASTDFGLGLTLNF